MATQGKPKKLPSKVSIPNRDLDRYRIPVGVVSSSEETREDIVGWIAACVLIAVLLPLLGLLYSDVLEVKQESKAQIEKVEKLRREIEQKNRKDKE
jgi:hypothetical protein